MRKPLPMGEQKKSVIWQEWERGTPMSTIARVSRNRRRRENRILKEERDISANL